MMQFVFVLVFLCGFINTLFLQAESKESLADQLFLDFLPPNEAAQALVTPYLLQAETPIVVRFTLIAGIAVYEAQAPCQQKALSFFGTRDFVPKSFCRPDSNAILQSFTIYSAISREFPQQAAVFAQYLIGKHGLNTVSKSRNATTLNGWANIIGDRLATFFLNDGWNSLGTWSSISNPLPFEDYTKYRPANDPYQCPSQLSFPLRWQPFMETDRLGQFFHQVFVVPQVGTKHVRPLVLKNWHVEHRRVRSPYLFPQKYHGISNIDLRKMNSQINDLIQRSSKLTSAQRFSAYWWDNKLISTAGISAYYGKITGMSNFEVAQQFMGEMMSQHDALLTVWREKLRHDLVRPRTMVARLRMGMRVRQTRNGRPGPLWVRSHEWRPLLQEQPHSEFPSGSAALCKAAMDHIGLYVKWKRGRVPGIRIEYTRRNADLPFLEDNSVNVTFSGPAQAAWECAKSRLYGGVHFRPAIIAGHKIGKGIGRMVFEHVRQLGEGTVPKNCRRCRTFEKS